MSNEQWTIVEEGDRNGNGTLPWTGIHTTLEEAIEAVNKHLQEVFGENSPTINTTFEAFGTWSNTENRKRNVVHSDTDQQSTYHFVQHVE